MRSAARRVRRPSRRAPIAAALLAVAAALSGADPAPDVELAASPPSVAIGREVHLVLSYSWPRGWTPVAEPDPSRDFSELFVTAFPPVEVVRTGEREERRFRLTVLAPVSGAWSLPRPALTVRDDHGIEHAAQAPEVIVQVGTESSPAQLAPPRPLWTRPVTAAVGGPRRRALAIAAAAVAALIALAIAIALRRRRLGPTATPAQRFAAELDAARAAGDGKESGARLSLALRSYAGAIWRFDGAGSTAREVAAQLRARAPDDEARTIARLLDELDALRWSAGQLPPSQVAPLVDTARAWVDAVERRRAAEALAAAQAKRAPAGAAS